MAEFIDISHPIEDSMPGFPGFPRPRVSTFMDHESSRVKYDYKSEFNVGRLDMVGSTGTYMDAPYHRHRNLSDISQLPLESFAGLPAVIVDAITGTGREIGLGIDLDRLKGHALLIRTGRDSLWGLPDYYSGGPFISEEMALNFVAAGIRLVGVDFANVDNMNDPFRPTHTVLLRAGILIVENLCNLKLVPDTRVRFFAIPLRVKKMSTMPVRAFLEVQES
jgi:arylformamidase